MFHVKHLGPQDVAYARELLQSAGIDVGPTQLEMLLRHLDWVLETNRTVRLTAVSDPRRAISLHLVDSLLALTAVEDAPAGRLVDIGTGAGYPGLPLAIIGGREAVLLESVQKKAVALQRFLVHENLEPRISVVAERSETYATKMPASAAVVAARAVSALPALVELAAPLLFHGGRLIALKGRPDEAEVAWSVRAAALCGLALRSAERHELPPEGQVRTILVYERCSDPSIDLPRRPGVAQKRPLGKA